MRWIVVATVRVKHDLTVEQLCWAVRRPQRHTVRQSSGDSVELGLRTRLRIALLGCNTFKVERYPFHTPQIWRYLGIK